MSPGDLNAGLQDQVAGLRFLQQNLAAFGGDPSKVTIWGQVSAELCRSYGLNLILLVKSAGAGSVAAQIIFPSAGNLFRAGIMDSETGPL